MSKDSYDDLLGRVRTHCQETAQDARPGSAWALRIGDYVSWYIPARKTCLILKPEKYEQEPTLAFAPASEQQIRHTEQQLGFPLPQLLRHLYAEIANGGFGPGYGIIGVEDGYPGVNSRLGGIAHRYEWEVDFADARIQHARGGWLAMTPRQRQAFWDDGIGSQELFEAKLLADMEPQPEREVTWYSPWPQLLLPLCDHGCGIITYLYADTEQVVQGIHSFDQVVAASLEEWLELWLAGEELQLM